MWFDHEISQLNTTGILTISPFGYFVTKPPLTLIPHIELETTGLQWLSTLQRDKKVKTSSLQSLVEQSSPENKVSSISNTSKVWD